MLYLVKEKNIYIATKATKILLDARTHLVRRYLCQGLNHRGRLRWESANFQYDITGQISSLVVRSTLNTKFKWYRSTHDLQGNLTFFEDYNGNLWRKEWGVPFMDTRALETYYEVARIWHNRVETKIMLYNAGCSVPRRVRVNNFRSSLKCWV